VSDREQPLTGTELGLAVAVNHPDLTPEDYARAAAVRKALGWRKRLAVWWYMRRYVQEPAGNWYEPGYLGGGRYEDDEP
jgi:hypothetical protein